MSSASIPRSSNAVQIPHNDPFEIVSVDENHLQQSENLAKRVAQLEGQLRSVTEQMQKLIASDVQPQRIYERMECAACPAIIEICEKNLVMTGKQRKLHCPACRKVYLNSDLVYKALNGHLAVGKIAPAPSY